MFVAFSAMAQERTVTGTVTAKEDGLPIPGVSVKSIGSAGGTTTDAHGKFTIKVKADGSIQFGSVGYTTKIVKVTGSSLNVFLESNSQELEVVTVAYGKTTKRAFTGALASIKSEDLEQRTLTNVNSSLAGAAPGIQVNAGSGQPGEGPAIRIRGFGSISSSNNPLYIVDGLQYSGNIANISTDDIESISVLKDAASSSLYGSSAANGVILITTKKGRVGKDKISVKAIQGLISSNVPEYDRVSAQEYYPLAWQAYRNSLVYPVNGAGVPLATANQTATNGIKALLFNNPFNVADNAIVGTDGLLNPNASLLYSPDEMNWRDPLTRVGKRGDYGMNVSGGSEKSDYYMSLGYLNEKGYLIRSDYNRINARVSVNSRPTTWFKTGLNLTGNVSNSKQADAGTSGSIVNPFNFSRGIGPIYPVFAHDPKTGALLYDSITGQPVYDTGDLQARLGVPNRPSGAYAGRNILEETLLNSTVVKRNAVAARTYGEVTFLKDFKFTTNVGTDISNYQFNDYQNKIVGDGAPNGRARNTQSTTTSYTIEQLLNYDKTLGKHTFGVVAGHNNYHYVYKYLTGARNTQIVDGNTELINFTTTTDLSSYTDVYNKEAYFGRLNYDFDKKYYASASIRADGSSKWAPDHKWGTFWSVSGGWIISDEDFLKNSSFVNFLKIRSSYGSLGNDGLLNPDGTTNYYPYLGTYTLGNNNASEPGILLNTLPNKEITWETITQADLAVDFGFFKNRLRGSVEVYNKKTTDLLFNVPLPLSSGIGIGSGTGVIQRNVGDMYNRGLEIQLGGDIVKTRDFKWDMTINWSKFKNQITRMPSEQPTIISGTKQLAVGHSIYDFWLRQWAGVDPLDGAGLYKMDPKNPAIASETRVVNGQTVTTNPGNAIYEYTNSAIPKFAGSVANTFTYKRISLNVLMIYSVGGKFYDSNYQTLMSYGSYGGALSPDALRSWQKIGDVTDVPRMDIGRSSFNNATSSRFLIDASYLTMRSATLSYSLPKTLIEKIGLSNVNVFGTGENLFLISKRKGLNPSESFTGVNSNTYTPARTVSLGLNATF